MKKSLFVVLPGVLSLFTAMFVPSLSDADDSPKMAKASQQELAALWSDLYVDDPAAANAVIKLYKIPSAAVPFLKEKLQPLKLDPDQCRRLLLELGSENEKVWKTAWPFSRSTGERYLPKEWFGSNRMSKERLQLPAATTSEGRRHVQHVLATGDGM